MTTAKRPAAKQGKAAKTASVKFNLSGEVTSIILEAPRNVLEALRAAEKLTGEPIGHMVLRCTERQLGYIKRNPAPFGALDCVAQYTFDGESETLFTDERGGLFLQFGFGENNAVSRDEAFRWFVNRQNRKAGRFDKGGFEGENARAFLEAVRSGVELRDTLRTITGRRLH